MDDVKHIVDDDGGQTKGRLVKHDHGRVTHQAARNGQHLLLAAGHGTGLLL